MHPLLLVGSNYLRGFVLLYGPLQIGPHVHLFTFGSYPWIIVGLFSWLLECLSIYVWILILYSPNVCLHAVSIPCFPISTLIGLLSKALFDLDNFRRRMTLMKKSEQLEVVGKGVQILWKTSLLYCVFSCMNSIYPRFDHVWAISLFIPSKSHVFDIPQLPQPKHVFNPKMHQ